ncbi:MAG: hypothetical protein ABIA37_05550 [Candidatus Woesearchaeota archaeon]
METTKKIITALELPFAYSHPTDKIKTIITAVSVIFLTGDYAYKINKPLDLGFLDFSTLEKRKEQCEKELQHNSLITPELYESVVEITEDEEKIAVEGKGEVIEYALKMRQVDPDKTMNLLLEKDQVNQEHIHKLAQKIFDFHQIALSNEEIKNYGSIETIEFNWKENFEQTEKYKPELIAEKDFSFIKKKIDCFIEDNTELFAQRIEKNQIKHCHGDFHSANVFIIGDEIYIFDAIVFNKRFPNCDIISEIAFMAMDLDFNGKKEFSGIFIDRYRELSGDDDIPKLLNFYKCYRAYIRGKIACFTSEDKNLDEEQLKETKDMAKKYFSLSKKYASFL